MDHRVVSPDSSTHVHISERSRISKKRKHKQKSKSKHKKVKSSSSESTHKKSKKHKRSSHRPAHSHESDEEIFDIKPLSGYVDDSKELHKEIFSIVSKKEVKDLLPPLLKKIRFKEFKSLCLEQLEIMSQKRLRHIIAGQEMVSSSSSEESELKEQVPDAEAGRESMDVSVNEPLVNKEQVNTAARGVEDKQPPSKVSILEEMSLSPNQDEINELIEPETQTSEQPDQPMDEQADENKDSPVEMDAQSLVMAEAELKELEFRARALKSLVIAKERQQRLEKEKENENEKDK